MVIKNQKNQDSYDFMGLGRGCKHCLQILLKVNTCKIHIVFTVHAGSYLPSFVWLNAWEYFRKSLNWIHYIISPESIFIE